jgi:pentatricopeptide repeat protein
VQIASLRPLVREPGGALGLRAARGRAARRHRGRQRRAAIVSAGGGAVVDWLLDSVVRGATQAEAARALAHLVADPWVAPAVLGRPGAVPCLLQFIFSYQPKRGKKNSRHSSFDAPGHSRGRSMLVAALMDIITSNCDNVDYSSFQHLLPADADIRDIAVAIEVIEQGGMHLDDHNDNSSNDGDSGLKGIGIKVLGGTTILGFSRENNSLNLDDSDDGTLELSHNGRRSVVHKATNESPLVEKVSSAVPGLWDDLQREHVAVPFATWAVQDWDGGGGSKVVQQDEEQALVSEGRDLLKIKERKKALLLFEEMQGSVDYKPDSYTYSHMIPCFVDEGNVEEACSCYNSLMKAIWIPSISAYCALVNGLCKTGDDAYHDDAPRRR